MFETGVFDLNGQTIVKKHDENNIFDDDVLSWFFKNEGKPYL